MLLAFFSSSFSSNPKSTSEIHLLALRNVDGASLENDNPTYFPNTCASLVSRAGESPVAGCGALITTTACSNNSSFLFSMSCHVVFSFFFLADEGPDIASIVSSVSSQMLLVN